MAIYHYSAQVISRSQGRNSVAAAAYRSGSRMENEKTGQVYDFTRKSGVAHSAIFAPANAPTWALERESLWNTVERVEKRKDAQVSREVNVALPAELSFNQNLELLRQFIHDQFVRRGMIADLSVHWSEDNPHAHIMLTMRDLEGDQFGKKNRDWNDRALLVEHREQWAIHANAALEKAQIEARIDHRSLEDQGVARLPQKHLGSAMSAMEYRGVRTSIGDHNRKVKAFNTVAQNELMRIKKEAFEIVVAAEAAKKKREGR